MAERVVARCQTFADSRGDSPAGKVWQGNLAGVFRQCMAWGAGGFAGSGVRFGEYGRSRLAFEPAPGRIAWVIV